MGKIKKRAGFTLIEVIVAMGILMIVVLALVSSYYSYYNSVKDLRYKAIGENLAQFQMEDIRNFATSILDNLVEGGEYPSPNTSVTTEFPDDIPEIDKIRLSSPNYPKDKDQDGNDNIYDSGVTPIDASFIVTNITKLCDNCDAIEGDVGFDAAKGFISSAELLFPNDIEVVPAKHIDNETPGDISYDFTLYLHKRVFPNYYKRIQINRFVSSTGHIYTIKVTVYWENNNRQITITGVKSAEQEQH
jgi:type II secretory pathway pseudopilin PulG